MGMRTQFNSRKDILLSELPRDEQAAWEGRGRRGGDRRCQEFSKPGHQTAWSRDSCTREGYGPQYGPVAPRSQAQWEGQEGLSWLLTIGKGPSKQRTQAPHTLLSMVGARRQLPGSASVTLRSFHCPLLSPLPAHPLLLLPRWLFA